MFQLRPLATIWATPRCDGATASDVFELAQSPQRHPSVSVVAPAAAQRHAHAAGRCAAPGTTMSKFEPRLAIERSTCACAPEPSATIATTEPTPMMTPSAVSAERMGLARSARAGAGDRDQHVRIMRARLRRSRDRETIWPSRISIVRLVAARDLMIVRHHHDRGAFAVEFGEQAEDFLAGVGIERAGGFVGQQQRRLTRQRARNRDALLLTAGKLRRPVAHALAKADARPTMLGARSRRSFGSTPP